ncbi:M23 family metallopeptidase [Mucilaginibacter corticis]|uniref:M23 family metallopeptidase n=1 Tax=Mucilaginibacter corticis TaxID=2597670 RepID=A0A556MF31_9SPHI|nr:M23 family metallopeptidase [Mucilaginibacter corticis]TSJ38541.1 M23 family metallopeptidase [Mucilaginibacter corticis]
MNKYFVTILLIIGCRFITQAQTIQSREYPKGYFRYPLDIAPSTAGGFAELRPSHFHSGLDFRTNQQSGYPVHAAADGYVSRIRVQFGGGGNIVYIDHPNGYTTVYMHNKQFSPQITKVLRDYQYQHQQFDVDFNLPPGQVNVCKGDVIAISGQSGAVAGPHLHFEIRDTKSEQTINPQLFGITIPDKVPPTITAVGIYQFLDDQPFSEYTSRQFLAAVGAAGNYHLKIPKVIELSGNVGFGISTTDRNSASNNPNGVYSVELKLDGKTVYTFAAERFGFDQTHAINSYIDYPTFLTSHRFIQKCFIPPGSNISLYPQSINRGIINFIDNKEHEIEYVVKDVAGNASTITLKVKSKAFGLPIVKPDYPKTIFHYNQRNEFSNDKVKVIIEPGNLYDDVDFKYATLPIVPGAYSVTHRIHNRLTPIHDKYDIWIKPDVDLGSQADKAVIIGTGGICDSCIYQDGYVKGRAKAFGDFYIKLDTEAPRIVPLNIHDGSNLGAAKGIFFRIGDNLSGVKSYNGKIDGRWVLMEWDFKTKVLSYTFDGSVPPGKHKFELIVGDAKNNYSTFTADFNR